MTFGIMRCLTRHVPLSQRMLPAKAMTAHFARFYGFSGGYDRPNSLSVDDTTDFLERDSKKHEEFLYNELRKRYLDHSSHHEGTHEKKMENHIRELKEIKIKVLAKIEIIDNKVDEVLEIVKRIDGRLDEASKVDKAAL